MTLEELYRAAIAADDAYRRELVRVYGRDAADKRYQESHTDAACQVARDAKVAADRAWLDAYEAART